MIQLHRLGVVAIVVTYQPVLGVLEQLLEELIPQVESVVLVDNGSHADLVAWNNARQTNTVEVLSLGENMGISAAHNVGIQWARDRRAEFVLLMDQDSIPAPDMVEKLVSAISELPSLAAAGPRYLDERQANPPPFIRVRGLTLERCSCTTDNSVVPVDYLISSGCLIPMSVMDKVGVMRDDFFIDYVDIEWGLRARHQGFQSYGVCSAHMQHSLGDDPIKFLGKKIPLHSPLRHYYHFRNAMLLYKESWVPLNWKLLDGWRLCLKYGFYSLFAKPRMAHLRMMTLGLWHGMVGETGKFKEGAS
ncbi:MAG: glycosyltransferase family 2 protein [Desulfobulbaceae bacterium]|nr:glycosyltransferase family 2 protein [Desulfobulbaceae bacterium]